MKYTRNYCYQKVYRNSSLENSIAYIIIPVIDQLDITSLIHSCDLEGTPAYHPRMILTLSITC